MPLETNVPPGWRSLAILAVWLGGAALSRDVDVGLWLGIGGVAVALAAALLAVDGRDLLPLYGRTRRALALGCLVGVLMTLMTYPLHTLMTTLVPSLAGDVGALYGRLGAGGHAWRALALVPIVLAEELVWRGSVQSALQRRLGARAAVAPAAALYALAHVPVGSPLLVAVAFACGLVWSGLRAATGGVLAPSLAHLLWDQVVLFLVPIGA